MKGRPSAADKKTAKVMHEWKTGTLHSGHNGPVVISRKQAIAIALSEAKAASKKKKQAIRAKKKKK